MENRKAFFFFSSETVLLHQTVIKEWLMFRWKTLTPTFILNPFLLNLEKSLTPTLLTHLRLCKMIISQFFFFFFSSYFENFDFLCQNCGKGTIIAKNLQKASPHSIWGTTCNMVLTFSMLVVGSIFSTFYGLFHFSKFLICAKNGIKGKTLTKNNL